MAAEEHLSGGQFDKLGMVTEAARRQAAKDHGVDQDVPEVMSTRGVRGVAGEPDKTPAATHHVFMKIGNKRAVYGVNTNNEYIRRHSAGDE